MKVPRTTAITVLNLILCTLAVSRAMAQQTPLKPGAINGETLSFTKARNYAFCEIYVGFGAGPNPELQCYNSTGTTGADSGCPAEAFAALNPKKLAADLGGTVAVLNPVNQTARKWWVVDELYLYAAGETYDFSGVKATWVAEMGLEDLEKASQASKIPYQPLTNRQLSKWVFRNGASPSSCCARRKARCM